MSEALPVLTSPTSLRDLRTLVLNACQQTIDLLGLVYMACAAGSMPPESAAGLIRELTNTVATFQRMALQLEHK